MRPEDEKLLDNPERSTSHEGVDPFARWTRLLVAATTALALLALTLPFRAERQVVDFPLSEDGYYSLSVARNVAIGNGVTIGGENLTNGFQPLFTALCVPAFLLADGDRVLGIRYVLGLHWLTWVGTALALGAVVKKALRGRERGFRRFAGWLTAFAYLASHSAFWNHFNGLETGFVLLLLACTWRYFAARPLATMRRHVGLGVLLGLAVLGRIDVAFLVVGVAVAVALPATRRDEDGEPVGPSRLARFLAVSGTALLVSSPWWGYNLWLSGELMPSSGSAQQILLTDLPEDRFQRRLWFAATEPAELAMPWLHVGILAPAAGALGAGELVALKVKGGLMQPLFLARAGLALIALVGGLWLVLRARRANADDEGDHDPGSLALDLGHGKRAAAFGVLLGLFALSLVAYYAYTSFATHHYWRYFASVMLVCTAASGVLVAHLCRAWRPLVLLAMLAIAVPVPLAIGLANTEQLTLERYKGRRNAYYRQQVTLVERGVPEGERVASRNSGTLGFFRDGVANLDGKVNRKALEYEKGELSRFLDDEGIDWFVDWPDHVEMTLGEDPAARGWELVDREGGFYLYRRRDQSSTPEESAPEEPTPAEPGSDAPDPDGSGG